MKILTWNVGHQATPGKRDNLSRMAEALATLSPDIIVLTEYAPGNVPNKLTSDLGFMGFKPITSECRSTKMQNHVLIASRMHLEQSDSGVPLDSYHAIPCNALQVTIPEFSLGILGLRMPVQMTAAQKKRWWDWITAVAEKNRDHPFIILGDFNTDVDSGGPHGWKRMMKLKEDGWYHAQPKEGASFWFHGRDGVVSPFTIDHAFFSQPLSVKNAEYITESGEFVFVKIPGELKPKAMSDHAVLLVEFDLPNQSK
jgi:endonuclease/exonuclease/phosphatase family metal-dependent hydrolase